MGTRPTPRSSSPIARSPHYPILILLAVAVGALAAGLRPDSFYSGDPGIKLIAARAAIGSPFHPFDIPLPVIGNDHTPHVEGFLTVHGPHAHAVTSPIFPMLSAPFLATFGLRGLYLLPALGFLGAVAACGALATAGTARRSPTAAMAVAAIATPFLFYGLEFWEHMPAVACATFAAAFFLTRRAFVGGLLLGLAILLRPEALWFAVALIVASPLLTPRPGGRACALAVAGALLAVAPYEIYVIAHFGVLAPPHLATNSGGVTVDWAASRWTLIQTWFGSIGNASFWSVAPCVVGACAALALPRQTDHRFLWTVAIVDVVLTLLTAPNDGGSQWGARYLLFAYVPLTVLTADVVSQLPRGQTLTTVVLVLATAGCLWIDRSGYRQLRSTKISYGRIVDFMREKTAESEDIVTDVWWLDQIAAATIGERQWFYAPDGTTGEAIVKRLSDRTVPLVTVVRSATESADTSSWSRDTCYFEERRDSISVRNLVAIRLHHLCGH